MSKFLLFHFLSDSCPPRPSLPIVVSFFFFLLEADRCVAMDFITRIAKINIFSF